MSAESAKRWRLVSNTERRLTRNPKQRAYRARLREEAGEPTIDTTPQAVTIPIVAWLLREPLRISR